MVDDPVLPACHSLLDLMVHEVSRELGRGTGILEAPDNAVVLPLLIHMDDAKALLGIELQVSHVSSGSGDREVLPRKPRDTGADRKKVSVLREVFLYRFHVLRGHAVGQVPAVSLVPPLLETVSAALNEILCKLCFQYLHVFSSCRVLCGNRAGIPANRGPGAAAPELV